ncbi:YbaN family protein [Vibrio cionasavignyae]|uniref:YbaN family protein n=1 Tax=Vibrio cionasavignyae TaxID=2910252 RepID=UPI003D135728
MQLFESKVNMTLRQALWSVAGISSVTLGVIGVFLPLLPTTPFLLLASACFLKGSPHLHQRLLAHPKLGPVISTWETERAVSRATRNKGIVFILASFLISIIVVPLVWLKAALFCLCGIVLGFFLRLPVKESVADKSESH